MKINDCPPPLRIRCMVCDRPVARIDVWSGFLEKTIRVTVHCHGDTDTMDMDAATITRGTIEQLHAQEGRAFTTARITKG